MTTYFQFIFFLSSFFLYYSTPCSALQYSCPHDQSLLLLNFKESFTIDEYNSPSYTCETSHPKTKSWNKGTDCCLWEGITCDKVSNQVTELDLSCSQLGGTIDSNSTLFQLSHLKKLNLGFNRIKISQISKVFGNFTHLTHLNLSYSGIEGKVPAEILKLRELTSLDLSDYYYYSEPILNLESDIFKLLLTNFTKLRQVSLSGLNISSFIPKNLSASLESIELRSTFLKGELPQSIFQLPNLKTLYLGDNKLYGLLPSSRWNSYASLEWLDLSSILFPGKIPESIRYLKGLKSLDLSYCGFNESLLQFSSLINLTYLRLRSNRFYGPVPLEFSSLTNLTSLDFSSNNLNGHIDVFSTMKQLKFLELSSNNFSGHVDVDIFSNMKQLFWLDLSHNSLSLVTQNNSTLPESLKILRLAHCNISTLEFLKSARLDYWLVDLSMNNIQHVPSWLWSPWNNIETLNISYNSITSIEEIRFGRIITFDMRSNLIQGPFKQVPTSIQYLFVSDNQFSGVIPPSICEADLLQILDLSNNSFTGSIPSCIGNSSSVLAVLDMRMNKLEGTIPSTFSSDRLEVLNLHGNYLQGNIPSSLATCSSLRLLDLGNNILTGTIPSWLGDLPELQVLSLRSNNFHGKISFHGTTSFSSLHILDLSHNQLIGTLQSRLFKSFTKMMEINKTSAPYIGIEYDASYKLSTIVVSKGAEVELVKILTRWNTIDLSSNNFEGNIPASLGSLVSLRQLNFSNNRFSGEIPISFGNLHVLESLDLSSNQLNGTIPTQLTTLDFLSKLNLSFNHLTGRIPDGSHFETFTNDSYIGNNGLCGFALSKKCIGDEVHLTHPSHSLEGVDSEFIDGFSWRSVLTGYGVGMVVGLVIGCLMILTENPRWLIKIVEEEGYRIVKNRDQKKRILNQKKRILKHIGRNN